MMIIKTIKKSYRIVRGALATTVMFGVAPTYWLVHTGCRVVSIILPKRCWIGIDDYLWGSYQKLILFFFENMTGAEIIISGQIPKERENTILICNHQCTMDWIVTDILAVRQNMIGNLRYVFKDGIKYLPLYGYVFGVHGGVFVKRDGTYNDKNMKKVIKKYEDNNADMYFVVFPEGTRFSSKRKELLAKSQAYAIANDVRPLNQVLTPRVKAFHSAFNCMSKYVSAVYDATIVYEDTSQPTTPGTRCLAPNMWTFLVSAAPRIYIGFERVPTEEIPGHTEKSTFLWLHSRFSLKDSLICRHFGLKQELEHEKVIAGVVTTTEDDLDLLSSGDDLKQGVVSKLPLSTTLPPAIFFAGATAALLSHRVGRIIYASSLVGGSICGMGYAKIFL